MHGITITLLIDADGNYQVGKDVDDAQYNWDANEGMPCEGLRVYYLELQVPGPKAVTLKAALPDKGEEPLTLTIA